MQPTWGVWIRLQLVAVIVSIIVGLPIFFLMLDRFGEAVGAFGFERVYFPLTRRIFLIGALVPLLIDTVLVQYYWTRTGYFTAEVLGLWAVVEVVAVLGSLLFVRSFRGSLSPLSSVFASGGAGLPDGPLVARSTDEIGLLTQAIGRLIDELRERDRMLEAQNEELTVSNEELVSQRQALEDRLGRWKRTTTSSGPWRRESRPERSSRESPGMGRRSWERAGPPCIRPKGFPERHLSFGAGERAGRPMRRG